MSVFVLPVRSSRVRCHFLRFSGSVLGPCIKWTEDVDRRGLLSPLGHCGDGATLSSNTLASAGFLVQCQRTRGCTAFIYAGFPDSPRTPMRHRGAESRTSVFHDLSRGTAACHTLKLECSASPVPEIVSSGNTRIGRTHFPASTQAPHSRERNLHHEWQIVDSHGYLLW